MNEYKQGFLEKGSRLLPCEHLTFKTLNGKITELFIDNEQYVKLEDVELEKDTRIKYQDIVYKICALFDTPKEKCTIDIVVDKIKQLQEKWKNELGNCICMDCGKIIKTTEQSEHIKICSKEKRSG